MAARPLREIADIVRSKNAGPYRITFDILCREKANYETIRNSGAITPETVAKAYSLDPSDISSFFEIDMANAIKITIRRPRAQGSAGEGDMYGCQQHVPLMNMLVPIV
ncbi:DUF4387 domain-containing protein [Bosea sp. 2YAB26]|jgi:hypothetical protein|uniref:DUF4387 domain-containing protein n=1 Tax=Bosea sp. 2YAB26 TaxID=3237478 RepID=UPI003F8DF4AF